MEKFSFLGDVYLNKEYQADSIIDGPFFFNLEAPISNKKNDPYPNKINLCIDNVNYIKNTFGKYPYGVNLANNHIFDYGMSAFLDTLNSLNENNIKFCGFNNLSTNQTQKISFRFSNNNVIIILGYCCSTTNPSNKVDTLSIINEKKVINDIKAIKENNLNNFVVINLHYGKEEIKLPSPNDVILSRKFIDSGADLIIGHHAHVVQSYESYKGKKIYFGLGNCIFPDFELPSYFKNGISLKMSKKNNRLVNNYSLMVTVDENLKVNHEWLFFDGKKLFKTTKYLLFFNFITTSKSLFNFYIIISEKKRMILNFLKNPKKISYKRIKYFLKINNL